MANLKRRRIQFGDQDWASAAVRNNIPPGEEDSLATFYGSMAVSQSTGMEIPPNANIFQMYGGNYTLYGAQAEVPGEVLGDQVFERWRTENRLARKSLALKLQRFFRNNFEYSSASFGVYDDVHKDGKWFPVVFSKFRHNRFLAAIQNFVKSFRRKIQYELLLSASSSQGPHRRPSARREAYTWGRNHYPLLR